jgi:hypothetical protein
VLPAELLVAQDGLLTRRQALDAGLTDGALRHALRPDGPWRRLAPGVYVTVTGELTARQRVRAALLHAGPEGVLSGVYACRAHGLRYVPDLEPPLVLLPPTARVGSTDLVRVRRLTSPPPSRCIEGLPVAPVERAVLDCALAMHSLQDVRALVCESVQRRRTTALRLADALRSARRNGSALARIAVLDVLAGCHSAPECELRDLVRSSRVLPEPHWNTPLPGVPGVVPDGWWKEARLVVEVDSTEHHAFGTAPERTQRRTSKAVAAGWRVMPISPRRIRTDPASLLREIETAYLAGLP